MENTRCYYFSEQKREERINRRPPLLSLRVYFIGRERVGREGACRPAIKDANAGSYARAAGEFCIYVSWCGRLREIYSCSKRAAVSAAFKIKKRTRPVYELANKTVVVVVFFYLKIQYKEMKLKNPISFVLRSGAFIGDDQRIAEQSGQDAGRRT